MEIIRTGIEGLLQIIPKIYNDHRGWFLELFKSSQWNDISGGVEFMQDNVSYSAKKVLRGLHLQLGKSAQSKLVTVITGKALDVVVDTRKGSSTFGRVFQVELNSDTRNALFVPEGFAHGFLALEDTIFFYKCSKEYDKDNESGIRWDDPDLNINWNFSNPILSEKDKHLPSIQELLVKSVISR